MTFEPAPSASRPGPDLLPHETVIMAGGEGRRLLAVTGDAIPKALVPIGPRPLAEMMIEHLRGLGFRRFVFCARHLADVLKKHFGEGERLGVSIRYLIEPEPLGTAGGLAALRPAEQSVLVVNGDVIARHDFAEMIREHEASGAAATAGVRLHAHRIPFGVADVDPETNVIRALREKPVQTVLVNAGVYVLSPRALALLEPGRRQDMTDLLNRLIVAGELVRARPIREEWLDVGTPASYMEALEIFGGAGEG
jgi:NDP-sugar pyrophosphorylase family protein